MAAAEESKPIFKSPLETLEYRRYFINEDF